jgi:AraC-like DNA-binding protein
VDLGIACDRPEAGSPGELTGGGTSRRARRVTATSTGRPFGDAAELFRFSAPPAACVSSAGSSWAGAFLADVTTAPAGEYHHAYRGITVHHWRTPVRIRPTGGAGGWITQAPGFRVCVPGDEDHGEWRGSCQAHVLVVTPERVEAVLGVPWDRSGLTRWRGPRFERPFVGHVLSAMMRECEGGYPAGPLAGDALLVALLSHLDGRADAGRPPRSRALGRRLDLVLEYIEANLACPLTLPELARMAGVGVRRFGTIFAAETGWPPHRYVVRRRIERAKSLMLDTRLTLAEIGLAVGFSDQAQFSKVFRQHAGETPSAYRRR